ncbi:uncharacterized protein LOC108683012 [Hyalella azteca]|uniref:Uncharacterized protein LOC108683012 n=1 Tax=Hyalella azteca TaxID=294128 RepID=A0A979FVH2_HYAAZ|nr:uncharacterized protein LOC108683012 [Hyalella azteca]
MSGLERAGREGGYTRGTSSPLLPSPAHSSPTPASILGSATGQTFLSSMGQFLSSKLQSVSLGGAPAHLGGSGLPTYSLPKPTKPKPLQERDTRREIGGGGAISANAPIVFDLGPLQGLGSAPQTPSKTEGQAFDAAFLGSMPVNVATGPVTVISEVIRRVMSARAHHNLFSSTPVVLTVATPYLTVTGRQDLAEHPDSNCYRQRYKLTALTGWCTHRENPRLFGYVVRGVSSLQCWVYHVTPPRRLFGYVVRGVSSLQCWVYQCDDDASRVCRAITIADDPHARDKERSLILANIAQLEDDPHRGDDGVIHPTGDAAGGLDAEVLEELDALTDDQLAEMEAEIQEGGYVLE